MLVGGQPIYTHVPQRTRDDRCIVSAHYGCPDTFLNGRNLSEAGPSICIACALDPIDTDLPG